MILQTFNDEELLKEIRVEEDDGIKDKLLYWAQRQVKASELKQVLRGVVGNCLISWEPIKLLPTKKNNQFIAVNIFEALGSDGTGHCGPKSTMATLLYLKFPEKYIYVSENGKKKTGVTRNGYQYVLFSRNPKGEEVFFRITAHFLDRLYQRSDIFRKEYSKRTGQGQNMIQVLSEAFRHQCITIDLDEADVFAEDPNDFIKDLLDNVDAEELREYLKDGSLPIPFLDGFAIVRPVSSTSKVGVIKTFVHFSKIKDGQLKIGRFFGGRVDPVIDNHIHKY